MNQVSNRSWKLLSWNVRGINGNEKWDAIKEKITDSGYDIFCLQETKKETCDLVFLRNICMLVFDCFEFIPSIGASGGLITAWKSRSFSGELIFSNLYGLSVSLTSTVSDDNWIVTNLYGPCTPEGKKTSLIGSSRLTCLMKWNGS
jgi:hypothetical protein